MAISPSVVWKHSLSSSAASVMVTSEASFKTLQPHLEQRRNHCLGDQCARAVRKELGAPFYRTADTAWLHRQHAGVVGHRQTGDVGIPVETPGVVDRIESLDDLL